MDRAHRGGRLCSTASGKTETQGDSQLGFGISCMLPTQVADICSVNSKTRSVDPRSPQGPPTWLGVLTAWQPQHSQTSYWSPTCKGLVPANKTAASPFETQCDELYNVISSTLHWSKWPQVCQEEGHRLYHLREKRIKGFGGHRLSHCLRRSQC